MQTGQNSNRIKYKSTQKTKYKKDEVQEEKIQFRQNAKRLNTNMTTYKVIKYK